MNKFLFFIFSFFSIFTVTAQIEFDQTAPNNSVQHLIENVLVNSPVTGIQVSNVTVTCGNPDQLGYFNNANGDISLSSGVFLASNDTAAIINVDSILPPFPEYAVCPNDLDLGAQLIDVNIFGASTNNQIIIEFDFVAEGNSVEFEYVFASHEYNTYTCANFNDIFGFFISGPGISGPFQNNAINMAKIPDPTNPGTFTSTPVVINALNSGTASLGQSPDSCAVVDANWTTYSGFFVQNNASSGPSGPAFPNIGMNGFTVPLKAVADVQCGETYHLKLALADVGDKSLSSAVFLKEGSFNVVGGETEQSSDFSQSDSIMIEGCYPGHVTVKLSSYSDVAPAEILVDVSGTAQEGVDFDQIVDTLVIPAGDSVGTITLNTIADGITENNESVIITTYICNNVLSRDTFIISDPRDISVEITTGEDTLVCANSATPIVLNALGSEGYEPYVYNWFFEGTLVGSGALYGANPQNVGAHVVQIVGDCGEIATDTFWVGHLPPMPEASFTSYFDVETDKIVEGCEYGKLTITIPEVKESDTTLFFEIVGGSATENVDFYDFPEQITIPAGQTEASINIEAIVDGTFEGDEDIHIYMPFYDECSDGPNPLVLTIISNPLLNTQISDTVHACAGEEFSLDPQIIGGIQPYTVNWQREDKNEWTVEILEQEAVKTTKYYFTVEDACDEIVKDSITVVVPEYQPIQINGDYAPSISMCKDDVLELKVDIEGGIGGFKYLWYKDNIPFTTEKSLLIQEETLALFNYRLEVTDSCGNTESIQYQVKVEHCEVPNVFTPNGDDINDVFKFDTRDVEGSIDVTIMDRWGKEIFHANNYELCNNQDINCWDGINPKTEKECADGVYFYVIKYDDGRVLKGTFHLMR
jgi:gliding motility-associated-like protein